MKPDVNKINNLIRPFIEKSNRYPELCHVYAMLADNIVRRESLGEMDVTFTKYGYQARIENEWIIKKNQVDYEPVDYSMTNIQELDVADDYINTKIKYTNAINASYANKCRDNITLWLYFINKYLKFHKQKIFLNKAFVGDRFLAINSAAVNKICKNNSIKVSVIMCAFNAEKTLFVAVESILKQTHSNIELIIVNDKSTDKTALIADQFTLTDSRVKVIHNSQNLGAYVSRNIALNSIVGDYFTCHDADDIALPTRIENQLNVILDENSTSSICLMLRISPDGEITRRTRPTSNSPDGYSKLCHISGMHNTAFFRTNFGYWDSVRVGGDSELLNRIKKSSISKLSVTQTIEYLAMDCENSATRDASVGLFSQQGLSVREKYKNSWLEWHQKSEDTFLEFPQKQRKFFAPPEILNKY